MTLLRVALLQLDFRPGESRPERTGRVVAHLSTAPEAELLVLPELWDVGYFAFDDWEGAAAPVEESAAARLPTNGSVLVAGSVVERAEESMHNTAVVLGGSGAVLGIYRKSHLFGLGSREQDLMEPGTGPATVETPAARLGMATCFDLRYPDHFGALRAQGADLLVVVAAWPAARSEHWRVLAQARAIETQTPLVACNGVGPCAGTELAGGSLVIDARGNVVADAGTNPGWLTAELDLDDTTAWRAELQL